MLHTVNQSPFRHQALADCLRRLNAGDALLLLEDGVYGALPSAPQATALAALNDVDRCVLQADWQARGLGEPAAGFRLIDMAEFVRLAAAHPTQMSWHA